MDSPNHTKNNNKLSNQKTERALVLAILQSKSQVVSSHRRRTDIAFKVDFRPRRRPRSASLRCARSNEQASKQASNKQAKRQTREDCNAKREKTERRNDAQKEPNDLQRICTCS